MNYNDVIEYVKGHRVKKSEVGFGVVTVDHSYLRGCTLSYYEAGGRCFAEYKNLRIIVWYANGDLLLDSGGWAKSSYAVVIERLLGFPTQIRQVNGIRDIVVNVGGSEYVLDQPYPGKVPLQDEDTYLFIPHSGMGRSRFEIDLGDGVESRFGQYLEALARGLKTSGHTSIQMLSPAEFDVWLAGIHQKLTLSWETLAPQTKGAVVRQRVELWSVRMKKPVGVDHVLVTLRFNFVGTCNRDVVQCLLDSSDSLGSAHSKAIMNTNLILHLFPLDLDVLLQESLFTRLKALGFRFMEKEVDDKNIMGVSSPDTKVSYTFELVYSIKVDKVLEILDGLA